MAHKKKDTKCKCDKQKPKKEIIVDMQIIDADGSVKKCKGIKKPNGKVLIDNPYYTKRKIKIERD